MLAPAFKRRPTSRPTARAVTARWGRREPLGLTRREFAILARLTTPQNIQAFLNSVPINHEPDGATIRSVSEVLRVRRAHCIEGAFLAACALWIHGAPPLVMHMDCDTSDYPHVVALFRSGGSWGAISKTNGAVLRFRDPIYRSLRELAVSYFHEYCNKRGHRTLRSYSVAFDLRRIDPRLWVSCRAACQETHDRLVNIRHYPLVSPRQLKLLSRRDPFERRAAGLVQYPPPPK